jgi:quercetin dioxygenase-like cupin family protein
MAQHTEFSASTRRESPEASAEIDIRCLTKGIADVLFKFAANEKIVLHRHKAHNNTFVVQGEHRLYKPDGTLKEVRAVGSMTSSPPDVEPHREGGGDQDVIIAFSIRGDGVLYELLDDDKNIIGTISFQDLIDLHAA